MDFNDIKNTWKNSFKEESINQEELIKRLKIKKKSSSVLDKIKRNYISDVILGTVLLIVILYWLFQETSLMEFFILLAIILLVTGPMFAFMFKSFSNISVSQINSREIKEALKIIIDKIDRYVRFGTSNIYKFLILPFSILFGMLLAMFASSDTISITDILSDLGYVKIAALLSMLIIASAILVPFSQMFTKRMYKRHLEELKNYLTELEEISND